ncbi:mitochondrial ribosomal subunit protein-domain-containing protein [Suillus subalutaceus]|uniref:mitochondrial ribosomal subunit protein-domain-containing protein n=1 Tax=Suillus subalutaceus TaxID=48586 RepID=UPI001B86BE3F|nr:mitochondrial ribosomal subunit protein-domain-containing protein [Suillus subalutaceus]KAG1864296.1 mitochondrial ribosomal subunit protein-domain-containing protein [Suillus subalutaceus]
MATRQFHATTQVSMRKKISKASKADDEEILQHFQPDGGLDVPVAGYLLHRQQRQTLYYMRLIEHEIPKLRSANHLSLQLSATPLVIRSVDFAGEQHPLTAKRSVVVPVAHLPLRNEVAFHRAKLLAGVRWMPEPPRDSGISTDEDAAKHGFIKIACEDFPRANMNLKWISDTLDKLVLEANAEGEAPYQRLPLDTRHLDSKVRKSKKGDHVRGRGGLRPSLKDFPTEWLPKRQEDVISSVLPSQ